MTIIEVTKGQPLKFRTAQGEPYTVLDPGQHEVAEDLLGHWYLKAAIKSGRVRLLGGVDLASGPDETVVMVPPVGGSEDDGAGSDGFDTLPGGAENDGTDLESRMLAVFPKLTDKDFKTDGTPYVVSVEKLLGEDVSADQVAAAWAKYTPAEGGKE